MNKLVLQCILYFVCSTLFGQPYKIDANIAPKTIMDGHLKMGHPGPAGKEILINNRYLSIGGKPIIPVMGEFHFSRYPRAQWEDIILKMKANGIDIIACYVIWIHHEEIEGQFDWSGNKDLRSFIKLCQKYDVYAYPRIGPWCHGEVRNGGTPDWILKKNYLKDRSNHPVYQQYVDRYYCEIANQLKGLLYKDGGPVIGIQLENEYWRGQQGESHILWLKQTARKHGLDVPMYTITGWRAASVPKDEVIPLWGGYPAEPWATHIKKIKTNSNFSFQLPMNDESIGNDLVKPYGNYLVDYTRYPYFTCELGIGNQISEHRRPIIGPLDGLAIAIIKTGSGSNLLGYYVFTGGTNPTGVYTTLEENKEETGYWNEYPDISYDFQAAIRETGELAPSYYQIKKLHYFLNEFGSDLAPMLPVLPDDLDAKKALQYAIRAKNNSAFVFGLNYYRGIQKAEQKDVQFDIKLAEENIIFPSQAVNIPDSTIFIWPINFNMDDVLLKYATAQPLCMLASKDATDWYFIQNHGVQPEFAFAVSGIEEIEANKGNVRKYPNQYIISNLEPGINCFIKIKTTDGRQLRVTVLSYEESNKIWLFREKDKKLLFLSNSNLYLQNNKLHIFGESPDISLISFNDEFKINASGKELKKELRDTYVKFHIQVPAKDINVLIEKRPIFENASWLKTSVDEVEENNKLFNKLFIKEFSIGNPSPIKSSKLYLMSETACRIKANNKWINQMVNPNIVNNIDLTGYLKKGENQLMFAFPFVDGNKAFVAKIELDYFNSDQLEIFTDRTWLTTESYTLPAPWSLISNLNEPEIVTGKKVKSNTLLEYKSEWTISIPDDYLDGLKDVYLHINYIGDKGRCRLGHRLMSDNFNNGTSWRIALSRLGTLLENHKLQLELFPLAPDYRIYFEKVPAKEDVVKTAIKKIEVIPEYETVLSIVSVEEN